MNDHLGDGLTALMGYRLGLQQARSARIQWANVHFPLVYLQVQAAEFHCAHVSRLLADVDDLHRDSEDLAGHYLGDGMVELDLEVRLSNHQQADQLTRCIVHPIFILVTKTDFQGIDTRAGLAINDHALHDRRPFLGSKIGDELDIARVQGGEGGQTRACGPSRHVLSELATSQGQPNILGWRFSYIQQVHEQIEQLARNQGTGLTAVAGDSQPGPRGGLFLFLQFRHHQPHLLLGSVEVVLLIPILNGDGLAVAALRS